MGTTAERAFGITEVLEHIFSQLDDLDILTASMVCKTWANCIKGSLKLRRQCWLAPIWRDEDDEDPHFFYMTANSAPSPEAKIEAEKMIEDCRSLRVGMDCDTNLRAFYSLSDLPSDEYIRLMGIEDGDFLGVGNPDKLFGYCWGCTSVHNMFVKEDLHPLLQELDGEGHFLGCYIGHNDHLSIILGEAQYQPGLGDCYLRFKELLDALRVLKASTGEGSWQTSMITQPAGTSLRIAIIRFNCKAVIHHAEGVTLGDFFKAIQKVCIQHINAHEKHTLGWREGPHPEEKRDEVVMVASAELADLAFYYWRFKELIK